MPQEEKQVLIAKRKKTTCPFKQRDRCDVLLVAAIEIK